MDDNEAAALYRKYKEGTITPEEMALLEQAYLRLAETQDIPPFDREAIKASIWHRVAPRKSRRIVRWLPYAAAAIIALAIGTWLVGGEWWSANNEQELVRAEEILPGGNKATLTLADGRTINLSEAQAGIVVGEEINYTDGSEVVDAGKESLVSDVSRLMSLRTPKGGTYQITLPDGSTVWLNAGSTLRYPSQFTGGGREVELVGEAYFAVAKDADKPFRVMSRGQEIQVLGTEFNISAYPDEKETKTTLVEGSVRLRVGATGAGVSLVPGEQGTLVNSTLTKSEVDLAKYVSWKDGLFYFRDAGIDEVMKQMERWYDVAVVYEGAKPQNQFTGEIPRNRNASEVLAMLEYFGVKYRVADKTIVIYQP